jgi:hypothetical protein
MAEVVIVRDGWEWSRWNAARFMIEAALERFGLDGDGSWRETADSRVFVGTMPECEAVATALEGMGLQIERP